MRRHNTLFPQNDSPTIQDNTMTAEHNLQLLHQNFVILNRHRQLVQNLITDFEINQDFKNHLTKVIAALFNLETQSTNATLFKQLQLKIERRLVSYNDKESQLKGNSSSNPVVNGLLMLENMFDTFSDKLSNFSSNDSSYQSSPLNSANCYSLENKMVELWKKQISDMKEAHKKDLYDCRNQMDAELTNVLVEMDIIRQTLTKSSSKYKA